jgi:hypothetical protein
MKIRYKTGRFNHSITVLPGDELHLTVTEPNGCKQRVSEDITISMTVTHWVMFYVPGIGFGGIFGGPNIGEKMPEIFVNPVLIREEDQLIA